MYDIDDLIDKFWSDRITKAELQQLEIALRDSSSGKSPLSLINESIGKEMNETKARDLLELIHQKIGLDEMVEKEPAAFSKKSIPLWKWLSGAAMLIGLCILSYQFIYLEQGTKGKEQNVASRLKEQKVQWTMVNNNTDTMRMVSLPDGTVSSIYPGSGIKYAKALNGIRRDIYLVGTAKFKVAKDRHRPFTVFAYGVATTALGTYFKVEKGRRGLKICLYEGKLLVHPIADTVGQGSVFLAAGEQLSVSAGFNYRKETLDTHQALPINMVNTSMRNRMSKTDADTFPLDYRNIPLSEVFRYMGKKYQVRFSYGNSLVFDSLPFTGHFNKTDSLETLLKAICGMNDLSYHIKGRQVIIGNE